MVYRIRIAAEGAGISTQLLRAWERRYGLLRPQRSKGGYRLYSDEDVAVLRGTKALVDAGRSISEVAMLPREQLRAAAVEKAAPSPGLAPGLPGSFFAAAIAALSAFDGKQLERFILGASGMGTLSSVEVCDTVLMPLLAEIGDRWEKGLLDPAVEHFGSTLIRRHLHALVQSESRRNLGAPAIVCASPESDLHEGGLLAFAIHAAVLGWDIVYLGPHTPLRDVVSTADRRGALGIALSLTISSTRARRREMLEALSAWRKGDAGRSVWLGGRAATAHRRELERSGLRILAHARDFSEVPPAA